MPSASTRVVLQVSPPGGAGPADGAGGLSPGQMPFTVLATAVDRVLRSEHPVVRFVWAGGEPLAAGRWFFEKAIALEHDFARPGQRIENEVVTRGALLDEPWADFLAARHFEVSLEVVGPLAPEGARSDPGRTAALRAARRLRRRDVPFRAVASLDGAAEDPGGWLRSFEAAGVGELALRPALAGAEPAADPACRTVEVLARLFDTWLALALSRLHVPDLAELVVLADGVAAAWPPGYRRGPCLTVRADGAVEARGEAGLATWRVEDLALEALAPSSPGSGAAVASSGCDWQAPCRAGLGRDLLRELGRGACGEGCPLRALLSHVRARLDDARRGPAGAAPARG